MNLVTGHDISVFFDMTITGSTSRLILDITVINQLQLINIEEYEPDYFQHSSYYDLDQ